MNAKPRKLNTYQKIQKAMKDNERDWLKIIADYNKKGEGYRPFLAGRSGWNAIERLRESGKIKLRRSKKHYFKCGYWVVSKGGK